MSYSIGQFYFTKRDLFLLFTALSIGGMILTDYSLPFFDTRQLALLVILLFIAKGILLPAKDTIVFITFFAGIMLLAFVPFSHVLLFLFFSFLFLYLTGQL
jgi:hypothetical protein